VAQLSTLGGLERFMFESFHRWLDRKLGVDAYELRGDEIVWKHFMGRFARWSPIRSRDIVSWQESCVGGMGFSVDIKLQSGRYLPLGDRRGELVEILKRVAPTKQLPFENV
jgi:hypothetical protein